MPLKLKAALSAVNSNQAELARFLDISRASVNLIVAYDQWPKSMSRSYLTERVRAFLASQGATADQVKSCFEAEPLQGAGPAPAPVPMSPPPSIHRSPFEEISMLLRKHTLTREARAHFKIPRDPFTDEMESEADVFVSDDIRAVRAAMRQTARHGGILAVIGESGGGKSTLRHDLIEWINVSRESVTVIQPYVLGMEESERRGKALKAQEITGAVIRAVSPGASQRQNAQDRAAQMHDILCASAQVGRKHVLIIEEAHCLSRPTIKHLKRFYEVQDGFKKLLSIILIGQTELDWKLSEHDAEVREVVQRCEKVHLPPLDNHVEAYLRHKLDRVDADFGAIFAPDAIEEVRNRLRINVSENVQGRRQVRMRSLCYPLAINNLVSAAMNEAVKISAPKVNGALIAAAVRSE